MTNERIANNISALAKQGKYDAAIDDLIEHLQLYPNDIYVRKLLRGIQIKRLKDPRVKASGMGKFMSPLSAGLGSLGGAEKAMVACERALTHNPLDVGNLKALGAAARRAGHLETAVLSYETAREQKADDPGTLKALYALYAMLAAADEEKRGLFITARERCAAYLKIKPGDRKARREMERLTTEAAIHEGAWESTERFSEHLAKKPAELEKAAESKALSAEGVRSIIDDLTAQVEASPEDAALRKRLAELHARKLDYVNAAAEYKKILELQPDSTETADRYGDLALRSLDVRIEAASKALKANPQDQEQAAKVQALSEERNQFGIADFERRVRHRPTDRRVRLELAGYLLEGGRTDDALREFQQCQNDQRFRAEALYGMGRCLVAKGMVEFAIDQLRKAQEAADPGSRNFLEITYDLGGLFEQQQEWQGAELEYKKVFEIDIGFRDVSQRMELVYKKARGSD